MKTFFKMTTFTQPSALIGNRYQIIDQLGVGGMGSVYRAVDRLTNQPVALKKVSLDDIDTSTRETSPNRSVDFRLALAHEFKLLSSLRHPHIIDVLDYGFATDKQPYFTMTLIEKSQTLVSYGREQPFESQIDLLIQLFQALSYLHRQHIIHCDIKPPNVLVGSGSVKVLDFGLALISQKHPSESEDRLAGTLAYMAPELLQGNPATVSSDLYAAGIMMYEVFTGHHPFRASDTSKLIANILTSDPDLTALNFTSQIKGKPAALSANIDPDLLSERMVRIVEKLLNRDTTARYQNAEVIIADLYQALSSPIPTESIAIRESFLQAAKFVGRNSELAELENALQEACSGRGSTWLIGGESGIGKSRFLEELNYRAMIRGVLVLRGQAAVNKELSYQTWRTALRPLILSVQIDDFTASIVKAILPDIGTLVGRILPDAPDVEGSAWTQRLSLAIVDLFKSNAVPVLLLLEDLQWADESLEPLKFLNRVAPNLPLLIVGSYRNDEYADLPAALPEMRVLPLPRLTPEAITELSTSILGDFGVQPDLIDLLQRETEGNAFFLVEVVRTLALQAGRLSEIAHQPLPQKVFAKGINTLLNTRLEHISERATTLLRAAAIGGRQLDLAVLARISDKHLTPPLNLPGWLTECVNAALLNRQNDHWQFIHDKLREALLANLAPADRRRINREMAEAIEYVYPEDVAYSALLVEFWHEANDPEKEYFYLLLAAQRALTEAHMNDALALGKRALNLISLRGTQAIIIFRLIADAYWGQSRYDDAKGAYQASLDLARTWNDQQSVARALRGLGNVAWRQSQYDEAQVYFEESLVLCRQLGFHYEIPRILQSLGWVAIHHGNYPKARVLFEESLMLSREAGALFSTAESLRGLGEVFLQMRDYSAARTYYDEGMVLARQTGDRRSIAALCRGLGEVAQYEADYAYARICFEELLSIMREIGDPRGMSMALYGLATIAIQQTDYNSARDYQTEGLTLAWSIGARRGIATNLCNLAFIELKCNKSQLAADYLNEALTIAQESHDVPVLLNALAVYAWLFATKDQLERTAELIQLITSRPETPAYTIKLIAPLQTASLAMIQPIHAIPEATLDTLVDSLLRLSWE